MKYTSELPQKGGWYWFTRKGLSFGVIVHVVDDQIDKKGLSVFFDNRVTQLLDFCDSHKVALWAGPIEEAVE